MSKKPEVRSIQPKPDKSMVDVIMRLKNNSDFARFREVFIRGRAGTLALISCSPQWNESQTRFVQGRVHELTDIEHMFDGIEEIKANFDEAEKVGGA